MGGRGSGGGKGGSGGSSNKVRLGDEVTFRGNSTSSYTAKGLSQTQC